MRLRLNKMNGWIGGACCAVLGALFGATPAFAQLPTGNLVVDAGLEPGTVLHSFSRPASGDPWLPGEWNAENADIISGATNGVSPHAGAGMLRLNASGGNASQVSQIVELNSFAADIDGGNAILEFSVWVNAAAAGASPTITTRLGTGQIGNGNVILNGGSLISGYSFGRADVAGFDLDSDPSTWEQLRAQMPIASGTRFLHYELVDANSQIPATGVFFDTASVRLRTCEKLVDNSFEPTTPLFSYFRICGNPWLPGEWNAEDADVINGMAAGIAPFDGTGMLRVNATGGAVSQVSQIIDLTDQAYAIDNGRVAAIFQSWFNTAASGVDPRITILAGDNPDCGGNLTPIGGSAVNGFNRHSLAPSPDGDPGTWEAISKTITLPPGTRFLHYELQGVNSTIPGSGLFFDATSVCLKAALRSSGLPALPIGAAQLAVGQDTVSILVSNIGSSGEDGIAIDLGESQGWIGQFQDGIDPSALANGIVLESTLVGSINGLDEQAIVTGTVEDIGNQLQVSVDFSNIASGYTIEVYNDGNLAGTFAGTNGPAYIVDSLAAGSVPCYPTCGPYVAKCCGNLVAATNIQIVGGPVVVGDRIEITSNDAFPTEINYASTMQILGAGIDSFTLVSSGLQFEGSSVSGVSNAGIGGTDSSLGVVVYDLGSSGQDGVTIADDDDLVAESYSVAFANGSPLPLVNDDQSVTLDATGVLNGNADSDLGTASIDSNGASADVSADFSALGSPNVRVEIYNNGTFVDSTVIGGGGVVGTIDWVKGGDPNCGLDGCGKLRDQSGTPCYFFDTTGEFDFTSAALLGGVTGDEIRLLAHDANGVVEDIDELMIRGTNIDSFTIADVIATGPSGCLGVCGDSNCDGVITVSDIAFFVTAVAQGESAWNASFPGGTAPCDFCVNDTNGDSLVTVSDIGGFVSAVTTGFCP